MKLLDTLKSLALLVGTNALLFFIAWGAYHGKLIGSMDEIVAVSIIACIIAAIGWGLVFTGDCDDCDRD